MLLNFNCIWRYCHGDSVDSVMYFLLPNKCAFPRRSLITGISHQTTPFAATAKEIVVPFERHWPSYLQRSNYVNGALAKKCNSYEYCKFNLLENRRKVME